MRNHIDLILSCHCRLVKASDLWKSITPSESNIQSNKLKLGMVEHIWEAEAGESSGQGQPEVHSETLSQANNK